MNQRYDLLAFLLLAFTVVFTVWLGISGPVLSEDSAKGIFNFLKEWQTLIGVIGAFGVGYMAVLPVWKQVRETQRQAAGAAIIPLMKTAETLEKERRLVFEARQVTNGVPYLVEGYNIGDYNEIYQSWPEDVHSVRNNVDSFREKLQTHIDRHPDTGREIDALRQETMKCIKLLYDELGVMSHAFAQQTNGLSYEDGDEDLSDDVLVSIDKRVIGSMERFDQFAQRLELALGEEIPRVWRRVRELERAAVGDPGISK